MTTTFRFTGGAPWRPASTRAAPPRPSLFGDLVRQPSSAQARGGAARLAQPETGQGQMKKPGQHPASDTATAAHPTWSPLPRGQLAAQCAPHQPGTPPPPRYGGNPRHAHFRPLSTRRTTLVAGAAANVAATLTWASPPPPLGEGKGRVWGAHPPPLFIARQPQLPRLDLRGSRDGVHSGACGRGPPVQRPRAPAAQTA